MSDAFERIRAESFAALSAILPKGSHAALLDHPNHFNAGDLLIYRGELTYLAALDITIDYASTRHSYDASVLRATLPADGSILLHGGGNFGDRYEAFQRFREQVIQDFPDHRIVQLPQTIEFSSAEALERAQCIYSAHPNLFILVRDHAGRRETERLFPNNEVRFCPDLAFGTTLTQTPVTPAYDAIVLKRKDRESVHRFAGGDSERFTTRRVDWHASVVDNFKWWPATLLTRALHSIRPLRRSIAQPMIRTYAWQTDLIIRNAVEILSSGHIVVTDRLHAAIYATLLGKPVVMVDNANKKLSAIYRDYMNDIPETYFEADFVAALERAEGLRFAEF